MICCTCVKKCDHLFFLALWGSTQCIYVTASHQQSISIPQLLVIFIFLTHIISSLQFSSTLLLPVSIPTPTTHSQFLFRKEQAVHGCQPNLAYQAAVILGPSHLIVWRLDEATQYEEHRPEGKENSQRQPLLSILGSHKNTMLNNGTIFAGVLNETH